MYKVNPLIVVKVPKPGTKEYEQFCKEVEIFCILLYYLLYLQLVSCFMFTENSVFLEYMRDIYLSIYIQQNYTRNPDTIQVTQVKKLEPLILYIIQMNDLSYSITFLESLRLVYSDLQPENILLDYDRLKLSDFNCTTKISSEFDSCISLYRQVLGKEGSNDEGTLGKLGL